MKRDAAFAEARKQTGQGDDPPQEKLNQVQGKFPGMPDTPKPVRNRLMLATFVRPVFERTKKGEALIGLDLSFPLTSDHEGLIPKEIEDNWETMIRKNAKRIDVSGIDAQYVKIHLVPDDKADIIIESADVAKAVLAIVVEKGKGATKKVVRLSLRLVTERTKALRDFIWVNDGDFVWLELAETQGKLKI